MKKELILVLLILFTINNIFSQITDSCYIEIPNPTYFEFFRYPISISIKDTSNIIIESDENSAIIKYHNGNYKVAFYGEKGRSTINVYKKDNNNGKHLICRREIPFKKLHVTASISDKIYSGQFVSIDQLNNAVVKACILNYGFEAYFKVKSFTMTFVKNNNIIDIKTTGCFFTEEQLKCLKEIDNRMPVIIRNIIIERYNNIFERIDPIVFFIKTVPSSTQKDKR